MAITNRRGAFSTDLKHAAVRMSRVMSTGMVAAFLNMSEESVRRTVNLYNETGDVNPVPTGRRRGRPPALDSEDLKVSICETLQ
jgi:transposase